VQSALVTPATRISARNPAIVRGTAFSGFAGMSFVLVAARTAARRWSARSSLAYRSARWSIFAATDSRRSGGSSRSKSSRSRRRYAVGANGGPFGEVTARSFKNSPRKTDPSSNV